MDQWQAMSIYTTMSDAIRTLLHGVFEANVLKAIQCDQLTLNVKTILIEILNGKMTISIATAGHEKIPMHEFDFILEELVENL